MGPQPVIATAYSDQSVPTLNPMLISATPATRLSAFAAEAREVGRRVAEETGKIEEWVVRKDRCIGRKARKRNEENVIEGF